MNKHPLFDNSPSILDTIRLLELVAKSLPDEVAARCSVDHFTNCRERGYTIAVRRLDQNLLYDSEDCYCHATFANHRNSDNIVLYCGGNFDPGFGTNSVTTRSERLQDKEYGEKRFFQPTSAGLKKAAAEIVKFLYEA